jgi:hypothetical protein
MFLSKEKLLEDHKFVKNLADAIAKVKRSYIAELFQNIQPDDSGYDIEAQASWGEFIDSFYQALVEKIVKRDDLILEILDSVLHRLTTTEDGKEKITEILDKTNHIIVEHKKKSKEPWVNIVGDVFDDNENRFKVALDWNDAFIAMLRKQGITAEDESEVVEMWLQGLANQ